VWNFGTAVEHDMDEAEARVKKANKKASSTSVDMARQRVLDTYLQIGEAREEAPKGRFRDPALSVNRKR